MANAALDDAFGESFYEDGLRGNSEKWRDDVNPESFLQ